MSKSNLIGDVRQMLVEVAAKVTLPGFQTIRLDQATEKNGQEDIVTKYDIATEESIRKRLSDIEPGALVIGEESFYNKTELLGAYQEQTPVYTIDPIDGTWHFARRSDRFSTMLSRVQAGEITHAWLYHPVQNVFHLAQQGAGAFRQVLNQDGAVSSEKRLKVLEAPQEIEDCHGGLEIWGRSLREFSFPAKSPRLRVPHHFTACEIFSSVADDISDLCPLAEGERHPASSNEKQLSTECKQQHFGIFPKGSTPWDAVAGVLLVREAGGIVTDRSGHPYQPGSLREPIIIATTDDHVEKLTPLLNRLMPQIAPGI